MAKAETVTRVQEPPRCTINIPPKSKASITGFSEAEVNKKVFILISGTVKEVADSSEEWSPGKRITLHITGCKIQQPAKGVSLDQALRAAAVKV